MSILRQHFYRYNKPKKKDLRYFLKYNISNNSIDYESKYYQQEYRKQLKRMINDFFTKFIVYYTDDYDIMKRRDHKKYSMKDYNRHTYEIVVINRNDKTKYYAWIGLPLMTFDNRYSLDLTYIFDCLSYYAVSSYDIGDDLTEKESKKYDNQSKELWDFLDVLENKEGFWIDVLGGSF